MSEWTKLETQIQLTGDQPYFQGHFPKLKVYPGVSQIQDVCDALEHHLGYPVNLERLNRVKFLALITPPSALRLKIEYKEADVRWQVWMHDALCGSGQGQMERA